MPGTPTSTRQQTAAQQPPRATCASATTTIARQRARRRRGAPLDVAHPGKARARSDRGGRRCTVCVGDRREFVARERPDAVALAAPFLSALRRVVRPAADRRRHFALHDRRRHFAASAGQAPVVAAAELARFSRPLQAGRRELATSKAEPAVATVRRRVHLVNRGHQIRIGANLTVAVQLLDSDRPGLPRRGAARRARQRARARGGGGAAAAGERGASGGALAVFGGGVLSAPADESEVSAPPIPSGRAKLTTRILRHHTWRGL